MFFFPGSPIALPETSAPSLHFCENARSPAALDLAGPRIVEAPGIQMELEGRSPKGGEKLRLDSSPRMLRGDGQQRKRFDTDAEGLPGEGPLEPECAVADAAVFGVVFQLGDEFGVAYDAEVQPKQGADVVVVMVLALEAEQAKSSFQDTRRRSFRIRGAIGREGPCRRS